jgi:hypothetical protein
LADAQNELKEDRMLARKIVHTLCGAVLLGVLATSTTGAMTAHRTTYFTFSGAVEMPRGVSLAAGTYIFEVANPDGGSDVVRVLSRDRKKVYLMGLTRGVDRPSRGNLKAAIILGETAIGAPPKVKAWYPESETHGREFLY